MGEESDASIMLLLMEWKLVYHLYYFYVHDFIFIYKNDQIYHEILYKKFRKIGN